jgi:hypothetical protein
VARPKEEGLTYFPHDTNAANDLKIEPLLLLYKSKGYAFYFIHLEYIYRNGSLELDISDAETREVIQQKLGINSEEYNSILFTALKKQCFDKEYYEKTGRLTSDGVKKRAEMVFKKRENMRKHYESKNDNFCGRNIPETIPETPQSKVKKSKVKKSKVYKYTAFHSELANYLLECILKNKPDFKNPPIDQWSDDIRLMSEVDGRELEQIKKVIAWCQSDSFWKTNILSANKLRIQFDKLELQMQQKGGNNGTHKPDTNGSARQPSAEAKRFNNRPLD